jgi:hypothetical protein
VLIIDFLRVFADIDIGNCGDFSSVSTGEAKGSNASEIVDVGKQYFRLMENF